MQGKKNPRLITNSRVGAQTLWKPHSNSVIHNGKLSFLLKLERVMELDNLDFITKIRINVNLDDEEK